MIELSVLLSLAVSMPTLFTGACSSSDIMFTKSGEQPVIRFTDARDGQRTVVLYNNEDVAIFRGLKQSSFPYNPHWTENWTVDPSSNLFTGVYKIKLFPMSYRMVGMYTFVANETDRHCVFVYLYSDPMQPTIKQYPGNSSEGETVVLRCESHSSTLPENHNLTMLYEWKRDDANITSQSRFSVYKRVASGHLAISKAKITDTKHTFTCIATEEGSGMSTERNGYRLKLQVEQDACLDIQKRCTFDTPVTGAVICSLIAGVVIASIIVMVPTSSCIISKDVNSHNNTSSLSYPNDVNVQPEDDYDDIGHVLDV
ncbi:hypothetical protein DPMN_168695 [Dreissena polymorpha]|uniref:Ig-like domain-containing protein n=1 Tax=Dreissena polymorpha TaxID=45954 RepID=A0A9D4F2F5_DREPO|nr:hypothetical protein DPMN_168695 [Dreissena polymorpha]